MKIDTNKTAGKIAVMQAYENGENVQFNNMSTAVGWETLESNNINSPAWDWVIFSYRISPQTLDEAAKEYSENKYPTCADHVDIRTDFKSGAKWQKEQDNE